MKAHIKLELFGDNTRQMMRFYTNMIDDVMPGVGTQTIGTIPPSCWVAEITGLHPKYKFERNFLKGKKDYSESNSKGSRGIYLSYYPEHGKIYEVKSKHSWRSEDRYFCTFDANGEHRLTEEEVLECLKKTS